MNDAALLAAAEAGDLAGYASLHQRHVVAAWGLAQAITRDDVTAQEAVRRAMPAVFAAISRGSYPDGLDMRTAVFTATRAAAVVLLHSSGWTGRPHQRDVVDRAFSGLPECWRSALWLVEVEGLAPIDAARPLRLPPDEVLALVARARGGFVDRYVRLSAAGRPPACQETLTLLPRLGDGGLAPHEVAAMDQHLTGCQGCRAGQQELAALGPTLRRIAVTAPRQAMAAPSASPRPRRDGRRLAPALVAVLVTIFGLSLVGSMPQSAAKAPGRAHSPIDAGGWVRDPLGIRNQTTPTARVPAPSAAGVRVQARAVTVVSGANPGRAAVETGHGAESTGGENEEESPEPPPAQRSPDAAVEVGGVGVAVSVDSEATPPVAVDISAGPDAGLRTPWSGSGA